MQRHAPRTIDNPPANTARADPASAFRDLKDDTAVLANTPLPSLPPEPSYKPPAPELSADLEAHFTDERRYNDFLAQCGTAEFSNGTVTIEKKNPLTRKYEWLDKFPAADFLNEGVELMEYLGRYGAGDYMILAYKGGGSGITHRFYRTLAPESRFAKKEALSVAHAASPAPNGEMTALVKQLASMQEMMFAFMTQQKQPGGGDDFKSRLQELVLLREALGGNAPQTDQLGMLTKVISLARDMQPPGEGGPGMLDVAERWFTKLGPLLTAHVAAQTPQRARIAGPAAAPGATPAAPHPSAPAQPAQPAQTAQPAAPENKGEEMFQRQMIKFFLNMLIDSAAQDADPFTYANMVIDKVPEETLQAWINEPSLAAKLAEFDKRVNDYPEWFAQLRTEIVQIMGEEAANDAGGDPLDALSGEGGGIPL